MAPNDTERPTPEDLKLWDLPTLKGHRDGVQLEMDEMLEALQTDLVLDRDAECDAWYDAWCLRNDLDAEIHLREMGSNPL